MIEAATRRWATASSMDATFLFFSLEVEILQERRLWKGKGGELVNLAVTGSPAMAGTVISGEYCKA